MTDEEELKCIVDDFLSTLRKLSLKMDYDTYSELWCKATSCIEEAYSLGCGSNK